MPNPNIVASLDLVGNVWITGTTQLFTLPTLNSPSTDESQFVAELSKDGSSVLDLAVSHFGGTAAAGLPTGAVAVLGPSDSLLVTGPPDEPSFLMVANSATNASNGTIAPLELISLYGTGIGPDTAVGGQVIDGIFTNTLSGYQVLFNGLPAPILYAGPNQINVVSPRAIAGQQNADIEVLGPSGSTSFPTVPVAPSRPQIFVQPGTSQAIPQAIALNQDGTVNSHSNPASFGSVVTIWATGTGVTNDQLPDGAIVPAGVSGGAALPVSLLCGCQVTYAGSAPGELLGVTQINFVWPQGVYELTFSLQAGDSVSTFVTLYGH